jgi:hypothetical protein
VETIYLVSACIGGTLVVCQFLMGLVGFGDHGGHDLASGEHDVGHDFGHEAGHDGEHDHHDHHSTSWFFTMLGIRTVAAALTFFGLAGLAGTSKGLEPPLALAVAIAAGAGAFTLVGMLLRGMRKLQADGTVRVDRALGKVGTVYLRVPGRKAGTGKVVLNLQNRTVEFQAQTAADELPTGSRAIVVAVISSDTVEVAPVPTTTEAPAHV